MKRAQLGITLLLNHLGLGTPGCAATISMAFSPFSSFYLFHCILCMYFNFIAYGMTYYVSISLICEINDFPFNDIYVCTPQTFKIVANCKRTIISFYRFVLECL